MAETLLNLSTKHESKHGIAIEHEGENVLYLFAIAAMMPSEDLDLLVRIADWLTATSRLLQNEVTALPDGMPTSMADFDTDLFHGAQIVLPDAPEPVLRGVGRDGQAQIVLTFLAHRMGKLSPSLSDTETPTSVSGSRASRRSTAANRKAG